MCQEAEEYKNGVEKYVLDATAQAHLRHGVNVACNVSVGDR